MTLKYKQNVPKTYCRYVPESHGNTVVHLMKYWCTLGKKKQKKNILASAANKRQRFDVLFVAGLNSKAVHRVTRQNGVAHQPVPTPKNCSDAQKRRNLLIFLFA